MLFSFSWIVIFLISSLFEGRIGNKAKSSDEGTIEKVRKYCSNLLPPSLLFIKNSNVCISNVGYSEVISSDSTIPLLGKSVTLWFFWETFIKQMKTQCFCWISSTLNFQNKHTSERLNPIILFIAQIELSAGKFTKSSHCCHSPPMLFYTKILNSPELISSYLKWKCWVR